MKLFFPLIALLCLSFTSEHKYYVSLTEVTYNQESSNFEIATKVFYDDLEVAIFEITGERLQDGTEAAQEMIAEYILSRFSISVDGHKIPLAFVGTEDELDAIWIYFEGQNDQERLEEIVIENTVLTDFIPEQSNLVNFFPNKGSKKVKGMILNLKKPSKKIQL
ncbi:MAG: hypothetical protein KTR13_02360 [Saprospiraceae bacterium]|nr:hypothetical protein [Saprospiraceae bacterium]